MTGQRRPWPRPGRRAVALAVLIAIVGAVALVRTTLVFPVRVASASMAPTYTAGDIVLVSRTPPRLPDLHRGDLVAFTNPRDGDRTFKRVVALPGDVLVILDGQLHVNDEPVAEPYVDHRMTVGYYSKTFTVPQDAVFVLGDNRGNSVDSRDYGPVSLDDLSGRVLVRVWPVAR